MSTELPHRPSEAATEKTGPNATVDLNGLARFIIERKLGDPAGLRCENISFGHSNEVHLIHFAGNSWALRRPPRGPLLPTAHDVMREYRVLNALQNSAVPVPRVYAGCDDAGYIGAPFYLMEYMRGEVIRADGKHFASTPELRRGKVSEGMVNLLIALQRSIGARRVSKALAVPTDISTPAEALGRSARTHASAIPVRCR